MSDKMREEFETWIWGKYGDVFWYDLERSHVLKLYGSSYQTEFLNVRWEAWQASRKTLVVELPEPEPFNVSAEESLEMEPEQYEYLEARHGAQYSTYRKCRQAIEAAGLKVKS